MANKNETLNKNTEVYTSRFGALMSMVGMCVGLGNVWRFPYLCGQDGGGAFVVAYLICLGVVVIPLAIVEAGYGKGNRGGIMQAYETALHSKTAGKIIGGISTIFYGTMNFFFLPVMASSLYFMYVCVRGLWKTQPAGEIYAQSVTNYPMMVTLVVILSLVTGFVVYKGVGSGIEKMSKIMIPLMFLAFIIVVIFSAFSVDGIGKGYDWYLNPVWSKLGTVQIWLDAMGQALFSIGVGPGCMYIYGSHLKKKGDVTLNVTTVCFGDTFAALIAGMAIIPACVAMGLSPESGSGLIFVVLPNLLSQIPGGQIIGLLVFLGIFFAGITTAVAQFEVPVATFFNGFGLSRKKVAVVGTFITMAGALACTYSASILELFNNLAGNYGFIITAGLGAIMYSWVYGVNKIRENHLNPTSDLQLGKWFTILVKFIAVPLMLFIMFNSLVPVLQ